MSKIFSKVESLDRLRFEPFSAKAVAVVRVTAVDSTIVALGADGTIYTNGVGRSIGYCGGHDGKLSRVLDGVVKLRVLSAAAVKEHKDYSKAMAEKSERKWRAKAVLEGAERLGLPLTARQKEKLSAALG